MTDRQDLITLLDRFGIVYETAENKGSAWDRWDFKDTDRTIIIEADAGDRNQGYMGFWTEWAFDDTDNFTKIGIWE
jgi:hypothetical protein